MYTATLDYNIRLCDNIRSCDNIKLRDNITLWNNIRLYDNIVGKSYDTVQQSRHTQGYLDECINVSDSRDVIRNERFQFVFKFDGLGRVTGYVLEELLDLCTDRKVLILSRVVRSEMQWISKFWWQFDDKRVWFNVFYRYNSAEMQLLGRTEQNVRRSY